MAGFSTVADFANADELGQCWVTGFRKAVASAATTTSAWIDYSYFAGSPAANFYASAPLTAAVIDASRGIYLPSVAPAQQHLKDLIVMTGNTASSANARQQLALCDYLLYYPFIDTDAVDEEQALTNAVALPRYSAGQVVAVAQSAASTTGQFTFTYTNQDGTPGRVSQNNFTFAVTGGGQVVSAAGVGASYAPWCRLQAGDSAVKSIQSVTFTAAGGGLMALAIVKPLFMAYVTQECRTTGGVAFGAADQFSSLIHSAGAPRIMDGAVVNFFAAGYAGSLASSMLAGIVETVWN